MDKKLATGIGIAIAVALLLRGGGQPAGPIVKRPGDTITAKVKFKGKGTPNIYPIGFILSPVGYQNAIDEYLPLANDWQPFEKTVSLVLPFNTPAGLYGIMVYVGEGTSGITKEYSTIYKVEV